MKISWLTVDERAGSKKRGGGKSGRDEEFNKNCAYKIVYWGSKQTVIGNTKFL